MSSLSSKYSNQSTSAHLIPDFIMILVGPKQDIFLKYLAIDFFS